MRPASCRFRRVPLFSPPAKQSLPPFSPLSPEPPGYPLQRPRSQTLAVGALVTLAPTVRASAAPGGQVELEKEREARRGRDAGPFPVEGGSLGPSSSLRAKAGRPAGGAPQPAPRPSLTRKTALLSTQSSTAQPKSRATTAPTSRHRLPCQDMLAGARSLAGLERHGGEAL